MRNFVLLSSLKLSREQLDQYAIGEITCRNGQGRCLNCSKCILQTSSFNERVPDLLLQLLAVKTNARKRDLTNPINVHNDLRNS